MTKRALNPEGLPPPVGPYSNVVTSEPGRLVFVAGQVALDANGEVVGKGDIVAQTIVLGVLTLVLLANLAVLLAAAKVSKLMGVTGVNVINRVLGILLAALACQFVIDGILQSGIVKT